MAQFRPRYSDPWRQEVPLGLVDLVERNVIPELCFPESVYVLNRENVVDTEESAPENELDAHN